jgi:DnaK suppressor protein
MTTKPPKFDAAFLDEKRKQLMALRQEIRNSMDSREREEGSINKEAGAQARELEDDAQKLTMLENDGNLVSRGAEHLSRVERALKKLDEGTYGLSDVSGAPIPKERLDAMPDAVNTMEEQRASETNLTP